MTSEEGLKKIIAEEGEAVISLCQDLVRIPSEDPPGDTREIAGFIHDFFRKAGVDCKIISPHPEKPSVVATVQGTSPGPHVVFNGHIDTFRVGDKAMWSHNPFGGELVDGLLYGRGASDMKGGLAASIYSVVMLNKLKELIPGRISATCVSDEEVFGPWGTRYLLENMPELRGDALINGEPSSLENVRIGEKGQYWYHLTSRGEGGHGAYASLRLSAIKSMVELLESLSDLPPELSRTPAPIVNIMEEARENFDSLLCKGATDAALAASMNVGVIQGGLSVNMIPELCAAEVDFRLPPGVSPSVLNEWIAEVGAKHPACTIQAYDNHQDAHLTDPSDPLVQIARVAAEEVSGQKVFTTFSLGGTEARFWRKLGVPAITYGPNHHNMGSPDEYIVAEELLQVLQVQSLTALRFLCHSGQQ